MFTITFLVVFIPVAVMVTVLRSYLRVRSYYGRMAPRSAHLALASHGAGLAVLCWLTLGSYRDILPHYGRLAVVLGIPVGIFFCCTGIRYARGDADPRLLAIGVLQLVLGFYLLGFEGTDWYLVKLPTIIGWTFIAIGMAKVAILLMGHPKMEEGAAEEFPYGHQIVDQEKAEKSLKE